MRDLERFLSYAAGRLLDSQRIWDSFELTCHTLWAAYGRVTDDSDRGLTMLADTCLDLWRRQIAAAPPDLEREMFRWLGEITSLLHVAAATFFSRPGAHCSRARNTRGKTSGRQTR